MYKLCTINKNDEIIINFRIFSMHYDYPIFVITYKNTFLFSTYTVKKEKDFKRSIGKEVEVRTYRMIDKQKEFTGILKAYDKDSVTVELEDGTEKNFDKGDIALIRLAFDF